VGKPQRKRSLGRPLLRSEDNIKMELQEVGWVGMEWNDLAFVRGRWLVVVEAAMNFPVTWKGWVFLICGELVTSQEGLWSMELFSFMFRAYWLPWWHNNKTTKRFSELVQTVRSYAIFSDAISDSRSSIGYTINNTTLL
jgi:hypothetical protein